jgi:hypothetical protein
MSDVALGVRLAFSRLFRWSFALGYVVAFLLAVTVALLERATGSARATDHALSGAVFGIAVPLLCYFAVGALTHGVRLDAALDPLARHGASRKSLLFGISCGGAFALVISASCLTFATLVAGHGTSGSALARDIGPSLWVTVLAVSAYVAWFLLGSTFGARGRGKTLFLALDWIFGSGSGVLAVPWPRGHIRNLLGLEPVLAWPQWGGLCAVFLITLACFGLAQRRVPA